MKHSILKYTAITVFSLLLSVPAFADSVLTTPLDSRPISTTYLENLAAIAGDEVFIAGEKNLDYFSGDAQKDHFASSSAVRKDLLSLAKEHNNDNTAIIINTSSYLTGGLVGSRISSNYQSLEKGLDDLSYLIQTYPDPSYYIHLVMPRNLPETRKNEIWPDNVPLRGLGSYYLRYHPDSPQKDAISQQFENVTPSEFLLEWSYIENKAQELGESALTPWEKDFLKNFRRRYQNAEPYDQYIKNYVIPFERSAEIFEKLLRWQKKGYLDEIIIGNDDSQLPASIAYLYQTIQEKDWIPLEKGSPVKYSFARTFITSSEEKSIQATIQRVYSKEEGALALEGKSKNINFIFGLDEIPQMIYARSLAKRKQLSADFQVFSYADNTYVESYDVLNAGNLLKNGLNFLNVSNRKTEKPTDFYLFGYDGTIEAIEEKKKEAENAMTQSYHDGRHVALVELYPYYIVNTGQNLLFQQLLAQAPGKERIGITNLTAFSAWNTNANAIGLGLAHAQVYSIAEQTREEKESLLSAQIKMLGQHILEDGIYIGQVKLALTKQGYYPGPDEQKQSQSLLDEIQPQQILTAFENTQYQIGKDTFLVSRYKIEHCGFPWGRLFDCYLDFSTEVKRSIF